MGMIRQASSADRAQVISVWEACGLTRPWNDPEADFDRALAYPGSTVFVIEEGDAIIATAMPGFDGHRGWIYYLGTAPGHEGKRCAVNLTLTCCAFLREMGCPKVEVMVRDGNPAEGLYERMGWERQQVNVWALWLKD